MLQMGLFPSKSFVARKRICASIAPFRVTSVYLGLRHKTSLLSVPAQSWPHRILHRVLQKISAVPGVVEVGLKKQLLKIKPSNTSYSYFHPTM